MLCGGFLIFNMGHQYTQDYLIEMRRMYTSGDIYKEIEWHDSYIWDVVRERFEKKLKVNNFSISGFQKINQNTESKSENR